MIEFYPTTGTLLKGSEEIDAIGFVVTGLYYNTTRHFKPRTYPPTSEGFQTAFGINLWRGTVWALLPNGKRKQLRQVRTA